MTEVKEEKVSEIGPLTAALDRVAAQAYDLTPRRLVIIDERLKALLRSFMDAEPPQTATLEDQLDYQLGLVAISAFKEKISACYTSNITLREYETRAIIRNAIQLKYGKSLIKEF